MNRHQCLGIDMREREREYRLVLNRKKNPRHAMQNHFGLGVQVEYLVMLRAVLSRFDLGGTGKTKVLKWVSSHLQCRNEMIRNQAM